MCVCAWQIDLRDGASLTFCSSLRARSPTPRGHVIAACIQMLRGSLPAIAASLKRWSQDSLIFARKGSTCVVKEDGRTKSHQQCAQFDNQIPGRCQAGRIPGLTSNHISCQQAVNKKSVEDEMGPSKPLNSALLRSDRSTLASALINRKRMPCYNTKPTLSRTLQH